MISCVSKAFFIPADPLSPFLSLFVITNLGKSQSTHAAAPAPQAEGRSLRRGWVVMLGPPIGMLLDGYLGSHPA